MSTSFPFKLFCRNDLHKLGIADNEGNWNIKVLADHIENCILCKLGVNLFLSGAISPCCTESEILYDKMSLREKLVAIRKEISDKLNGVDYISLEILNAWLDYYMAIGGSNPSP